MRAPLILDTGALLAAIRRDPNVRAILDEAERSGREVLVPAGALAESIRGGPEDAFVNRLLKEPAARVAVHDEERARRAGRLLARASTTDAVDALVVAEAIGQGGGLIATSDPDHIVELAQGHAIVRVVRV